MKCKQLPPRKFVLRFELLIVSFLLVFALMFVLNFYTPMYFDDFRYVYSWETGERISSVSQIFPSMKAHYYGMNGRIPVHFLAQLFLLLKPIVFDLINSFAFALFILLICYYAIGSLKKISAPFYFLAFLLVWICAPSFGESFLWLTGSSNYLFGPLIALSFLLPYIKFYNNAFLIKKKWKLLLFSLFYFLWGILAGWTNENISLCVLIAQLLFIGFSLAVNKSIKLWMISGVLGNLVGSILLFSSPSYSKRSSIWAGNFNIPNMIKDFIMTISGFFSSSYIIIMLICIFIIILIVKHKQQLHIDLLKDYIIAIVFLLTSIAYAASTIACDYFPGRAWTAEIAMLCIVFLNLLWKNGGKVTLRKKSAYIAASLCLFIFISGSYLDAYWALKQVDFAFNEREAKIEQYHLDGKQEIALKPIESNHKFSCYSSGGDLAEGYWMNQVLEKYYNIKINIDDNA